MGIVLPYIGGCIPIYGFGNICFSYISAGGPNIILICRPEVWSINGQFLHCFYNPATSIIWGQAF